MLAFEKEALKWLVLKKFWKKRNICHQSTLRKTAEYFRTSKTTLHEDFRVRLKEIDMRMYLKVRQLLAENRKAAPVRGGLAHKKKCRNEKKQVIKIAGL
mgnify:CR=1 FL=1